MAKAETTLVTVLRHGEVVGRAHVLRGASDAPLSDRGRAQMQARLAGLPAFDRVAASPLCRCRAFAETVAAGRGLPLEIVPDFEEMHFGDWEGLTGAEAAASHPEAYAAWCRFDATAAAPGGETLGAFRRRVLAGWMKWLADGEGGHRLLISHAGVMRVLLQVMLDLPPSSLYRIALPEAAAFQVSLLSGHAPVLLSLNACADSCSPSSF